MAKNRGMRATLVLATLAVLVLVAWMFTFQVKFTEFAIVRTFGKTTRVLDGRTDAGLHFMTPFANTVVHYDQRTMVFEDPMHEMTTNDKQNIILSMFCAWRIKDPNVFQTQTRGEADAREKLRGKLRSAKSAVIGRTKMSELVNTDPAQMKLAHIEQQVFEMVQAEAMRDYGVEISLVGIKSLALPENVSSQVIEAMKQERQEAAGTFRAAGEAQAQAIRERARAASEQVMAFARRKAGEIRSQGDRAAAGWYSEFEKNWQFAAFLRKLESMKKELSSRSVFLLDGKEGTGVEMFQQGPSLPSAMPDVSPAGPTTQPAKGKAPGAE